jgi:hypothetical protein
MFEKKYWFNIKYKITFIIILFKWYSKKLQNILFQKVYKIKLNQDLLLKLNSL